jgi:hypothetical protein
MVKHEQTLTQRLAMGGAASGPAQSFEDVEVRALATSGHRLQQDVVRWQVGLDLLDARMVRAAGEQAMTDFLQVLQHAAAVAGSPLAAAGQRALAAARAQVARLGLHRVVRRSVSAPAIAIDDAGALVHIERSVHRAERCIADALELYALCEGGDAAAGELDPAARRRIVAILRAHAEPDDEARWMDAFLFGTGVHRTCIGMGLYTLADLERATSPWPAPRRPR